MAVKATYPRAMNRNIAAMKADLRSARLGMLVAFTIDTESGVANSTASNERHGPHGYAFLGFCRRNVSDGLQQPAIVEPVHPFQSCELDSLERAPRSASMESLS
jgi:hypothetical protein